MIASILALEVPSVPHVTIWEAGPLGFNKTAGIYFFATFMTLLLIFLGTRQKRLVPAGFFQNTAESSIDFVKNQIIMQTMGTDGLKYLPYMVTLFFFIFFSNITEILPGVQFPANSRFAMPVVLSLITWAMYMTVGIVKQGPLKFLKNSCIPPGVPKPILPLVALIELLQVLIVRPFSQAVRLFANMLAGHLILVTFAVLCAATWAASITLIITPFTFLLLVAMTGFEILVSFLQAFIFTILTALYIGTSMHPEH
ncbi:MAG: F0F1 ATP synthase subunit A [Actinomycetota bacterium]|nr:F0F1 ATP synthase subunit A [Actinomycetota bacterium]